MSEPLRVIRDSRQESVTLRLAGDLDIGTAGELNAAVEGVELDGRLLVIDVAQLEFVDSSGLRALLRANTWNQQHVRPMVLYGLRGQLLRLLELTDTKDAFTLAPDGPPAATEGSPSRDRPEGCAAPAHVTLLDAPPGRDGSGGRDRGESLPDPGTSLARSPALKTIWLRPHGEELLPAGGSGHQTRFRRPTGGDEERGMGVLLEPPGPPRSMR